MPQTTIDSAATADQVRGAITRGLRKPLSRRRRPYERPGRPRPGDRCHRRHRRHRALGAPDRLAGRGQRPAGRLARLGLSRPHARHAGQLAIDGLLHPAVAGRAPGRCRAAGRDDPAELRVQGRLDLPAPVRAQRQYGASLDSARRRRTRTGQRCTGSCWRSGGTLTHSKPAAGWFRRPRRSVRRPSCRCAACR